MANLGYDGPSSFWASLGKRRNSSLVWESGSFGLAWDRDLSGLAQEKWSWDSLR